MKLAKASQKKIELPQAINSSDQSLRDQFAKQALTSLINSPRYANNPGHAWFQNAAREAYEIADALLAERAKPRTSP